MRYAWWSGHGLKFFFACLLILYSHAFILLLWRSQCMDPCTLKFEVVYKKPTVQTVVHTIAILHMQYNTRMWQITKVLCNLFAAVSKFVNNYSIATIIIACKKICCLHWPIESAHQCVISVGDFRCHKFIVFYRLCNKKIMSLRNISK